MEIEIRGNTFRLLHQKAVYWRNTKTLLIADLHLGKITHFRKAGIALPTAAYAKNFSKLDELIEQVRPERIIFLGDLFHSHVNNEWAVFGKWRLQYPGLELIIVPGNHDVLPAQLYKDIRIDVFDDLIIDEFLFVHHPLEEVDENLFAFCGHVHPVYCLRSNAKQSIRLPCFVVDHDQMILPSFGVFTGGYEMNRMAGRQIMIVVAEEVIKT